MADKIAATLSPLSPYTIFTIPAYYIVTLSAHIYGTTFAMSKVTDKKAIDNTNPRNTNVANVQKFLNAKDAARYQRAEAAHANGIENFPLFVSAIFAGTLAGLSQQEMDTYAIATVVSRVLYNFLYITTERKRNSFLRSLVWATGTIWSVAVFVRAGLKLLA